MSCSKISPYEVKKRNKTKQNKCAAIRFLWSNLLQTNVLGCWGEMFKIILGFQKLSILTPWKGWGVSSQNFRRKEWGSTGISVGFCCCCCCCLGEGESNPTTFVRESVDIFWNNTVDKDVDVLLSAAESSVLWEFLVSRGLILMLSKEKAYGNFKLRGCLLMLQI